jgi:hypothetical protein
MKLLELLKKGEWRIPVRSEYTLERQNLDPDTRYLELVIRVPINEPGLRDYQPTERLISFFETTLNKQIAELESALETKKAVQTLSKVFKEAK